MANGLRYPYFVLKDKNPPPSLSLSEEGMEAVVALAKEAVDRLVAGTCDCCCFRGVGNKELERCIVVVLVLPITFTVLKAWQL